MREIKVDIAKYRARRKSRMDERKARFDFEVGVYPPDEPGDKEGHGNTRLPYGLCKAAGIDATDMTPKQAWQALESKTGIKADKAYDRLKKEGNAEKLAKEAEKLAKKKPKKAKAEPEGEAGSEEFTEKVVVAPDKPLPALTPATFKSAISGMNPYTLSVSEFAKAIEKEIMPRIKKGQTLDAGGHSYYCNGEGFEIEKGEERTKAFVAYRLAKYAKEGKSLSLKTGSGHSSKESEKESAKASASHQFKSAMNAARSTITSGVDHAEQKCAQHVKLVLEELPIGSKIKFAATNDDGKIYKTATVEKVGDDKYYSDGGGQKTTEQVSWDMTGSLKAVVIPSLDADDLSLPSELMTTGGYKYAPKSEVAAKPSPGLLPHKKVSSMSKASLKSGPKITVRKTTPFTPSKTATLRNDGKTRSLWRAIHARLFRKSDVRAVEDGMKRLFDENEFCMNRKGTRLALLLEQGFKNQIEVLEGDMAHASSMSYANPDERRKASKNLFGTPMDTQADGYEKYGFLGNPWSYDGDYGSTYGDVTLVFDKEKIKDRTTYTLGDSLGPSVNRGMVAGRCGDKPTFEGWYLSRPRAKALKMLRDGASLSEILNYTKNAYVELQFHGELTMSDVKYIVFKSESAYKNYVTKEMQAAFDELGIEVSIK